MDDNEYNCFSTTESVTISYRWESLNREEMLCGTVQVLPCVMRHSASPPTPENLIPLSCAVDKYIAITNVHPAAKQGENGEHTVGKSFLTRFIFTWLTLAGR